MFDVETTRLVGEEDVAELEVSVACAAWVTADTTTDAALHNATRATLHVLA